MSRQLTPAQGSTVPAVSAPAASTAVTPALAQAYARAVYVVDWGRCGLRLVPGERVARWQLNFGAQSAAFITACNPFSRRVADAENAMAMARLRTRVAREGLRWLEGEGRSASGDWPSEPSLLVLGLEAARAHRLAADFEQHALLLIDANGAVSVEFTRSETSCAPSSG